jgi:hypothetical protein
MDSLKKIHLPWIIVSLLVLVLIVMVFKQRRSGYTPPTGNVITMMDLQEFSAFSPEQKANYVNKLAAYQPRLSKALSTNSFTNYQMILNEVMTNVMVPQPQKEAKCPRGQFSATGSQPGCMPCPVNTYCPTEGTITPKKCPQGTISNVGSINIGECISSNVSVQSSMYVR